MSATANGKCASAHVSAGGARGYALRAAHCSEVYKSQLEIIGDFRTVMNMADLIGQGARQHMGGGRVLVAHLPSGLRVREHRRLFVGVGVHLCSVVPAP